MYGAWKDKKGFTMLELLMVVIVVGILATLALPQYMGFIERARAAEAITTIGAIRTAEGLYKLENGTYTTNVNDLSITVPGAGSSTYWNYAISNASDSGFSVTATRSSKKASSGVAGQTIVLTWNDTSGEVWSGSHLGAPH